MNDLQRLEEAKYDVNGRYMVGYTTARILIEGLLDDIKELNDRLTNFGESHLASAKRDLDKYRELENKIRQLIETIQCPEGYETEREHVYAIQQKAKKINIT